MEDAASQGVRRSNGSSTPFFDYQDDSRAVDQRLHCRECLHLLYRIDPLIQTLTSVTEMPAKDRSALDGQVHHNYVVSFHQTQVYYIHHDDIDPFHLATQPPPSLCWIRCRYISFFKVHRLAKDLCLIERSELIDSIMELRDIRSFRSIGTGYDTCFTTVCLTSTKVSRYCSSWLRLTQALWSILFFALHHIPFTRQLSSQKYLSQYHNAKLQGLVADAPHE
jgi:hypothetical protein